MNPLIWLILASLIVATALALAFVAWTEPRRIDRTGDTFDYPDARCPANRDAP